MKADSREVARPTLNLEQLQTLPVPVPPLAEQREIVRRVDALFAGLNTIERQVDAAAARTGKMHEAILSRAFRGELVPTDAELARQQGREYEPASVLLERVARKAPQLVTAAGERSHLRRSDRRRDPDETARTSRNRKTERRGRP